ncbi:MAG: ATP-binding cassette domain-containing protein [Bacteroidales bacterium]|nr:ATP-binding cassette domain-containing protein [Bacteroidales bacterium]
MSENILKALMQLFAIIARPESNAGDRRKVVESFLKQQLNRELVDEYLKVFDEFYDVYQKKQSETEKRKKSISLSSVKVLKICTAINEELTQKQKIVVLIRLLEFIKSEGTEITDQEFEFVETVADTFHITIDEYKRIRAFVLYSFDVLPNSTRVLIIDDKKEFQHDKVKHICSDGLKGQLRVFHIVSASMYVIRYLGADELYLNGQHLQNDKVYVLTSGTSLRNSKIKPIYYSDIISTFIEDKSKSKIVFEVNNLAYKFKGGGMGLIDINFKEESGKLVGIMGASGAGKSTLLNVLNGVYSPSSGEVLINGVNIHEDSETVDGIIGHVSQDDLLIEELTVFQNLYFNAKLCFDNYSKFQLIRAVVKTLQSLGLYEKKDMKVGSPLNKKISGGQRKRLNIALELIREPAVLFLDEPTSGLSSRDSENIMDLLKELALKGKLVFVVIHQPSSDIFKMFDKLIILDTGGYQIYTGDPVDSIIYFKSRTHQANWNDSECPTCGNVNPEQVFNIVESEVLDEYGNLTTTRKISPREWESFYKEYEKTVIPREITANKEDLPEIHFKIPNRFRQFKVFTIRDVLSKLTNTQYLAINLIEAPLLAFFLAFIIKFYSIGEGHTEGYVFSENSNVPVYIFMSVIVAIFMGLTVSAEEIIRDRLIIKRESFLNLSRPSYLFSKVIIMFAISAIQALAFVLVGNSIMEIQGMYFYYWLVMFSSFAFANMLGLNVSDSFNSAVTIYILIPFLVIPQMILSGIIVRYDKLNPSMPLHDFDNVPLYGDIFTARWAYEALAVQQFKNNEFEKIFYPYDKKMSEAIYKKDYWIKEVRTKISACERDYKKEERKEKVINSFELLRNEISNEIVLIRKELSDTGLNKIIKKNEIIALKEATNFMEKCIDSLYINKIGVASLNASKEFCNQVENYNRKKYNVYNKEKDNLISEYQDLSDRETKQLIALGFSDTQRKKVQEAKRHDFIKFQNKYTNESLSEFVKNSTDMDRILEYDNRLYQKMDPIYRDPQPGLIRSHFYSPTKRIFGSYFNTFWVNVSIIWLMTILLYLSLHFRLIKKLIEGSGKLFEKRGIKKRK